MFSSSSAETETPVQASRITVKPMFAYNSRDEDELSSAERNIPELSSEGTVDIVRYLEGLCSVSNLQALFSKFLLPFRVSQTQT